MEFGRYSCLVGLSLGAARTQGCFKAIKSNACSDVATFLF